MEKTCFSHGNLSAFPYPCLGWLAPRAAAIVASGREIYEAQGRQISKASSGAEQFKV
jgi:hypothetical protein